MAEPGSARREHGGGIDAMIAQYGGTRANWLDLSTGINPVPYPLPDLPADAWTALPDRHAFAGFETAARRFWSVPDHAAVLAAPGASALIARIPALLPKGSVLIRSDTYNEHAAAFAGTGWDVVQSGRAEARVVVHPNNPTGERWDGADEDWGQRPLVVIDESFCDEALGESLIHRAGPGVIVLKSIGKFWGLAGLRLGAAVGDPALLARLADWLGPWQTSGPALAIGTAALSDRDWAKATRRKLAEEAATLDTAILAKGARSLGGTSLFRLYEVPDAADWQSELAKSKVLIRCFAYAPTWLRIGLPHPNRRDQLHRALATLTP
ncbi:MAG: aminotransferase class I/II-fold pyridoxal phosphate-dependent enzyme [Rhodobacteraceae bacterium]|nr:aminotransferase class I/II-fold pyridoxal phosphate-dependent enzyme [Paracoccaceae bacterium]